MDVVTAFIPLLLASVAPSYTPTIVNVASVVARLPFPFASSYNASKAAVASYSDTLRLEVQSLGLRVVTLYMGEVSTPLMTASNINFGKDSVYRDIEESVKARTATHLEKTMPPAQFARDVIGEIINGKGAYVWKGTYAFQVWLLNAVGPRSVFDSIMVQRAGLDTEKAKSSIYKLGQELANKQA